MLFAERVINAIRLRKRKPNKGLSYVDKNRDVCDDGGPHNRLPLRHGIYDLILVQLSANQKLVVVRSRSSKICSLAPDSNLFGKVFFSNSTCTQQSLFCWYPLSQSVVPSAREHQPICRRTSSIHCLHPVCPSKFAYIRRCQATTTLHYY